MNNINRIVKKSGSSFFWSMRLLPRAKREAMYTIYAFCRHIDDIVDGDLPIKEKQDLINAWREEIDNISNYGTFRSKIADIVKAEDTQTDCFTLREDLTVEDLPFLCEEG